MWQIDELLTLAMKNQVSDVHITVGVAPIFRLNGILMPLDGLEMANMLGLDTNSVAKLSPEDTEQLAKQIMNQHQYKKFIETGDIDFPYEIPGGGRFRVNAFKQRGSAALAIRLINADILSFQQLGLPDTLAHLCQKPRGLVLVTGPTGSGKSTTLATMIDYINNHYCQHIITLEDPIEYVHTHKRSIVNQREVGRDTKGFAHALRSAMREDPDVILVGEMRDLETISIAITAAETGHLVFGTLHTSSAAQTIDRIIDVFPPHQQPQIRAQLANTVLGVLAQQLIPRIDKPGRVAALEVMVATPAIRNLIREGKTYQIISQIQTGAKHGMQSLDACLRQLAINQIISREEAINRAADPGSLEKML
ncbi:type IV pilus twitching motility protein PilT [Peptococcaceae bacterium 1198_IL3148]